jgi:hypothetical protein
MGTGKLQDQWQIPSHVKYNGEPLVKGKHVTGFTNGEEEVMRLTQYRKEPS